MNRFVFWIAVILLLVGVALSAYLVRQGVLGARGGENGDVVVTFHETARSESYVAPQSEDEIPVPPPPFGEDIFPCNECHDPDEEVDRERRELTLEHEGIQLHHDEKNRWCLDCHNAENRDYLHLADGRLVKFTESYRLCGQCHGPTFRDWKMGIHGKRTGYWNGEKRYLLCVHCHDPHSPGFKPIHPFPAPVPPQTIDCGPRPSMGE